MLRFESAAEAVERREREAAKQDSNLMLKLAFLMPVNRLIVGRQTFVVGRIELSTFIQALAF